MVRKTHTIIVDAETNDRIEYEYDYSDRVWNVYAIDGLTGYIIQSGYAGSKKERDYIIENEARGWFDDTEQRDAARMAYQMFGSK